MQNPRAFPSDFKQCTKSSTREFAHKEKSENLCTETSIHAGTHFDRCIFALLQLLGPSMKAEKVFGVMHALHLASSLPDFEPIWEKFSSAIEFAHQFVNEYSRQITRGNVEVKDFGQKGR